MNLSWLINLSRSWPIKLLGLLLAIVSFYLFIVTLTVLLNLPEANFRKALRRLLAILLGLRCRAGSLAAVRR
jgi:uncharacterized membrane protein YkgB